MFISYQERLHHFSYLSCALGICLQRYGGETEPRHAWQPHRHSECSEKTWCCLTSLGWWLRY